MYNHAVHSELPSSLLTEDQFRCSVCSELLKDPVSIPCGHSHCRQCITSYWKNPDSTGSYACPQCRKRSRTRPVLYQSALGVLLEKLQQVGLRPAHPGRSYAEPGDVACDWCIGRKLKAVKSCLTCTASYCETHVKQHYTVPALQRHNLVEATEELEQRLCQIHHRALEVLCKTEKILICSLCAVEQHRGHDVICVKSEDSDKVGDSLCSEAHIEECGVCSRLDLLLEWNLLNKFNISQCTNLNTSFALMSAYYINVTNDLEM